MRTVLVSTAILVASTAHAGVPQVITYAGALEQSGAPANGTFSAVFTLFNDKTAGTAQFAQTESSLTVVDGAIVVDLGSQAADPLDDSVLASGTLFLEVAINGETLTPRVPLNAVPYARFAQHAADVNGLDEHDIAALNSADPNGGLVDNNGVFGIANDGVTNARLHADAVTTDKILDGTIIGDDVQDNSIPMTKIQHTVNTLNVANAACFNDTNSIPLLTTQANCTSLGCNPGLPPCAVQGPCFFNCGAGTNGVSRLCDVAAPATCPDIPTFFATAP